MSKTKKKTSSDVKTDVASAGPQTIEQFAAQGLDEKSGQEAMLRLQPLLAKQPRAAAGMLRLNTQSVASATLAVVLAVDELGLRPRFQRQAEIGEFELAYLERLPDLVRAVLFLHQGVSRSAAQSSEAQIPESVAIEATSRRERMLRVLEFHFAGDSKIGPELVAVRRGRGYKDLAADLAVLGSLYGQHGKTLAAGTPLHYQESDGPAAAGLAARIVVEIGKSQGQAAHSEAEQQLTAVTTLLVTAHDEVTAVARHLCRHDAAQVARFPSLFTATRARPRRSAAEPAEPTAPAPSSP